MLAIVGALGKLGVAVEPASKAAMAFTNAGDDARRPGFLYPGATDTLLIVHPKVHSDGTNFTITRVLPLKQGEDTFREISSLIRSDDPVEGFSCLFLASLVIRVRTNLRLPQDRG